MYYPIKMAVIDGLEDLVHDFSSVPLAESGLLTNRIEEFPTLAVFCYDVNGPIILVYLVEFHDGRMILLLT